MLRILLTAAIVWGASLGLAQADTAQKVKVYRLRHADARFAVNLIDHVLRVPPRKKSDDNPSANVRLAFDSRTNSLVLVGKLTPEITGAVEAILNAVDVPTPGKVPPRTPRMVQIELLVIETAKPGKAKSDGEKDQAPLLTAEQLKKQLNLCKPGSTAATKDVAARIDSLQALGQLRVARRAVVTALDGKEGRLTIGGDSPVVTGTSISQFGQQNSITYQKVGLTLAASPHVVANGVIAVRIRFSEDRLGSPDEGVVVSRSTGGRVQHSRSSSRRTPPFQVRNGKAVRTSHTKTTPKQKATSPPKAKPAPAAKPKENVVRVPGMISIVAESDVRMADGHTAVIGGLSSDDGRDASRLILVSAKIIND